MGWGYAVLSDYDLEMHLFGVFVRAARCSDRRGDGSVPVDHATGIPLSANDLLPRHKAVGGVHLALELLVHPRHLAAALLRRPVPRDDAPDASVTLSSIPPDQWSEAESERVGALEEQIKLKVHRLAERGMFDPRPDIGAGPLVGTDGLTQGFKITWRGLTEGQRRVRGTRFDDGPTTLEADVGYEKWRKAPQHARTV